MQQCDTPEVINIDWDYCHRRRKKNSNEQHTATRLRRLINTASKMRKRNKIKERKGKFCSVDVI